MQVGKRRAECYIPIELLKLSPGQRCVKKLTDNQTSIMIKSTARNAPDRKLEINDLINRCGYNRDRYNNNFGLVLDQKMLELTGRVIDPPVLKFKSDTRNDIYDQSINRQNHLIQPDDGIWDIRDKEFYQGVQLNQWAIACFAHHANCTEHDLRSFVQNFRGISYKAGMPAKKPVFCRYASSVNQIEPMFTYLAEAFKNLQLILVILPGRHNHYGETKRVADTVVGIPTQCIQSRNVVNYNPQTISNLCLKINAKLGGINSVLSDEPIEILERPYIKSPIFNRPVIFIGADVCHPPAGDFKKPSIASIVASMDPHPARYSVSIRLQAQRKEAIQDLTEMMKEMLLKFYNKNNFLKPEAIVYFRGGLTDGQFESVFKDEVESIEKACEELEPKTYLPKITYMSVQKRHHTRLFCKHLADASTKSKSKNIPPGTTIDKEIINPIEFDFYLCGHHGIQGTSRPAHYQVLRDDSRMGADEIQKLCFDLCYTYVRCTRSVSIPAPLYYAHLVAFRSRYHLAKGLGGIQLI